MRAAKLLGIVFVLIALLVAAHSVGNLNCNGHLRHDENISVNGKTVSVQLANTPDEQHKGLGGLSCISANEGMLFIFDRSEYQYFWMKDMRFGLDFVWLNSDKQVVTTLPNVDPSTYPVTFTSESPAKYVLELPAGQAAALGLNKGQQLNF